MTIESGIESAGAYIDTLNDAYPASGDDLVEGDNHIRGIKNCIENTFPNITGAVTPTHTELNYVNGVTSAIQTQIEALKIRVLLETQTASASATIDFTTGIDSTYSYYELVLLNVIPTSNDALAFQVSDDTGSTWKSGASNYIVETVGLTSFLIAADCQNVTPGINGKLTVFDPSSASNKTAMTFVGSKIDSSTYHDNLIASGRYDTAAAIDGIRVLFTGASTIASGTFKLSGYK